MACVPWKCFELEWRNYPRVRFFKDRYLGLYPRFERVTAALPLCFEDTDLMKDLRWMKTQLQKPPRVLVLGLTDVSPKDLVISASEEQNDSDVKERMDNTSDDQTRTEDDVDVTPDSMNYKHFEENIEQTLTHVIDKHSTSETQHDCMDVVVFRAPESWSTEELLKGQTLLNNKFCQMKKLRDYLPEQSDCEPLWNPTLSELPAQISSKIEIRIVYQFVRMFGHLKSFMRTERHYDLNINEVFRSYEIFKSIHNIVCNRYILAEILQQIDRNTAGVLQDMSPRADHTSEDTLAPETVIEEPHKMTDTQDVGLDDDCSENTFEDEIIKKICKSITCAAVPLLAAKHNLVEECCHKLLIEIQFNDNLESSIRSKTAKGYLSKVHKFAESVLDTNQTNPEREFSDKELADLRQFKDIVRQIQHDVEKTFAECEKTLTKLEIVITVMRKMAFEIKGYLTQSDVYKNFEDKMFRSKSLPKNIRESLLRIDGVFSVATVYGELEIELTRQPDEKTIKKMKGILKDGNYGFPYKIKVRETFLRPFVGGERIQFEQGDQLLSPNPNKKYENRTGTLGMCLKGSDGESYGMTCAHVVEKSSSVVELLKSCETTPRLFGSISEDMLVRRYDENISVRDIAAVLVINKSMCRYDLLDDTTNHKPFEIADFVNPDELIGKYVFKHGAKTGFTEGIIKSSDTVFDRENANHNFILIESLPTVGDKMRRDSGMYNYLDIARGSQEQLDSLRQNDKQAYCTGDLTKGESLRDSLLDDSNKIDEASYNTSDDGGTISELDEQFEDIKSAKTDNNMSANDNVGIIREQEQLIGDAKSNKIYHDIPNDGGISIEPKQFIAHAKPDKNDRYTSVDACALKDNEHHSNDFKSNKTDQTTLVAVCTDNEQIVEDVADVPRPELGEAVTDELRNSEMTNNCTDSTVKPQSSTKPIFADEGDSGAVVCMNDLASDSILVLSMISAGDTISKDPFCVTLPMTVQMDALTSHITSTKPHFRFLHSEKKMT